MGKQGSQPQKPIYGKFAKIVLYFIIILWYN